MYSIPEGRSMSSSACILVIDRDDGIRDFLRLALADEGYTVTVAPNIEAGLAILRASPIDLILLDIVPSVKEIHPLLANFPQSRLTQIPAIVMSTSTKLDVNTLTQFGITHVLYKPFDLSDLLQMVAVCMYS
jgi:DNA-binding NtrC family response regulator